MSKDIVFVWIPKNAGTSVWSVLAKQPHSLKIGHNWEHDKPLFDKLNKRGYGVVTTGHLNFPKIYEDSIINKEYLNNAFKFCVVRNPWDRVVSLAKFLGNKELKPFLKDLKKNINSLRVDSNVHGYNQANPQVNWIFDDDGNFLVDRIVRFENLDEELHNVFEEIGLDVDEIPHLNQRPHDDYRDCFDEETKKLVEEIYAEDIEVFNYKFE